MPNWVKNILMIKGKKEDVEALRQQVGKGNTIFSFENIVPTPEFFKSEESICTQDLLNELIVFLTNKFTTNIDRENILSKFSKYSNIIYKGSINQEALDHARKLIKPEDMDILYDRGKALYDMVCKYGAMSWYEFHLEHWGTKWDACESECILDVNEGIGFRFDTAWAPPVYALLKLQQMFPSVEILHWYADSDDVNGEDWGVNRYDENQIRGVVVDKIQGFTSATRLRAHELIAEGNTVTSLESVAELDGEMDSASQMLTEDENEALDKLVEEQKVFIGFDDWIGYAVICKGKLRIDLLYNACDDHDDTLYDNLVNAIGMVATPSQTLN